MEKLTKIQMDKIEDYIMDNEDGVILVLDSLNSELYTVTSYTSMVDFKKILKIKDAIAFICCVKLETTEEETTEIDNPCEVLTETTDINADGVTNQTQEVKKEKPEKRKRGQYLEELTEENVKKHYDEGLSQRKISEVMGVPLGTLMKFLKDHNLQKTNSESSKDNKSEDDSKECLSCTKEL